jgi:hypothetical protein
VTILIIERSVTISNIWLIRACDLFSYIILNALKFEKLKNKRSKTSLSYVESAALFEIMN